MQPVTSASTPSHSWKAAIPVYGIAVLILFAILTWIMKLGSADLSVPFYSMRNDGSLSATLVKGVIDNGWFEYNPYIGSPGGLHFEDFPTADSFNFLLIRILALFSSHFGVVLNLFFLLQFVLITVTALYVFRRYNISSFVAVPISILYSLLPAHFGRGEYHLFLGAYYMVPLAVMVSLWVCSGEELFTLRRKPWQFRWRGADGILSLAIFAIVGSCGLYYAVFCSFVMVVAALISFGRSRSFQRLLTPATLLFAALCSLAGNALPTLISVLQNGPNHAAVSRGGGDGEVYALRIAHLILPMSWHRIPAFHAIRIEYNSILGSWANENDFATLGIIGACGFLILLVALFWSPVTSRGRILRDLSLLNLACLLLATASGFGPLLVYLLFPAIRAYNRISVVIAFFSLFAIALVLDGLRERPASAAWRRPSYLLVIGVVLLLVGVFDQTSTTYFQDYAANRQEFYRVDDFVNRIEHSEPAQSMIFQLPYVPFPETPPVYKLEDYGLFDGYLHSHSLRWSYGAMKGRPGDSLEKSLAQSSPGSLAANLSFAGFAGLYIDRFGYPDGASDLQKELSRTLSENPIADTEGRRIFFDLRHYASSLRGNMTAQAWAARQAAILRPVLTAPVASPAEASTSALLYNWGTPISFGEESDNGLQGLFGDGWAPPYKDFRWTIGKSASLRFSVEPTDTDRTFVFSVHSFLPYAGFPVHVFVDGVSVGTVDGSQEGDHSVLLPLRVLQGKRSFVITLDTPAARSPKELKINDDGRILGLAVRYITIN